MFASKKNMPAEEQNWAGCLQEVRQSLVDRTLQLTHANQELANQIAERQRVEAALRQAEEKYRSIFENAIEGIFQTTPQGRFLSANPALARIYGYASPEALKAQVNDIGKQIYVDPRRREAFVELVRQQGSVKGFEAQVYRTDGSIIWISENARAVCDDRGELLYYEGMVEDITSRKQTEAALLRSQAQLQEQATQLEETLRQLQRTQGQLVQTEKMSSLGQLVAGVAHEINNPVSFVCGNLAHATQYAQDLLDLICLYRQQYSAPNSVIQQAEADIDLDFLIEDLPKTLESMQIGADRIRQIVLSLRNFSRLDEAQKKPVNIHEGIDSTLMILQNRLKARSTYPEIEVDKYYADLPLVECYAGQLNQVFMNLLSNSIDALEETLELHPEKLPSPKIGIATEAIDSSWVRIKIFDNGPGIPPEIVTRLFDPFFTTKPIGKGTGLGLSISYQIIVEKHGGRLNCVSEPHQGAMFVIEIPVQTSERPHE
ncbi:PAS domain S-box protein [Kamptonema cortianum]|nr:PAS domain S-box protein [Kamptonema cortianum]